MSDFAMQYYPEADDIERREAEAERQLLFALYECSKELGVGDTLEIVRKQARIEGWENLRFRWWELSQAIGRRLDNWRRSIEPFDEF